MCYSAMVERDLKVLERKFGAIAVRTDFDAFEGSDKDDRIFPGRYAAVIHEQGGRRIVDPMRYGAYPPLGVEDRQFTTFNARRDNLQSPFWNSAFMKHHGVVVLHAFYEWVAVADLLKAGVVTLAHVTAEFDRQIEDRKAKVLANGKKYRMTPTEQKDSHFRKIIIEFRPSDGNAMITPAIFNRRTITGVEQAGFAIVTDDPPPYVSEAGHDRCPVILDPNVLQDWLQPAGKRPDEVTALLQQQRKPMLIHSLPKVA